MNRLNKIERLKDELRTTDYITLKFIEGVDCSQYGDWKEERQAIRDEINRLSNMTNEEFELEFGSEVEDE